MRNRGQVGLGILGFVLFVIVCLAMSWLATGNDFFLYKVFAPKYVAVQQQVFVNGAPYIQGKSQDIDDYMREYQQATPQQKPGLATIILHEIAGMDMSKLPDYQQQWIDQLRSAN